MSRIGKRPVEIPTGVTVEMNGRDLSFKGPKGELAFTLVDEVICEINDNVISVIPRDQSRKSRSMWGMQRTLVANYIEGVHTGYKRDLDITGVGFRAMLQGKVLVLQLGYSHDIFYPVPEGIEIKCEKPTSISITGNSKQRVGQVAAEIRALRAPEPYKGNGVKYVDEYIFRKEGKKK
jgi:ribosomal protein L6, bacterial type